MSKTILSMIMVGLLGWMGGNVAAQSPMGPGTTPGGLSAGMRKLFGEHKAFTAKLDMVVKDKSDNETMSMGMDFAQLDGQARADIDLSNMKSAQMPAGMGDQLKLMGMDKITSITRPDKNVILIIYPGLKSYVEMPLPKDQQLGAEDKVKLEVTEQGKESVDGHSCSKNKVVMTDENGVKREGLVWKAKDLKDFPVKMQFAEQDTTFVMTFKSVKFNAPEKSQFEAPDGLTKHASMQALMQGSMQRMMQQQTGGGEK
ncbi:MAG TPA: DUF4412 domain-containing protein [Candidatus Paceibacterota bacterium]|nr:DUF4412 domain-containing protein [Verrucomicrobiota bacterium]HRY48364.1 DUF4412 domain-containing protein [Candidatus Paceibacterota bacterium]HSA01774.1 DUF4412 domain-containing protein [Candidatus Paceibacterota bacterium]